jgi:hypothetical protein
VLDGVLRERPHPRASPGHGDVRGAGVLIFVIDRYVVPPRWSVIVTTTGGDRELARVQDKTWADAFAGAIQKALP